MTYFKPAGVRMVELEEVVLGHDEIEAMRLKHLLGLSQEEAGGQMNISQPTLHRLLSSACEKIADAIVSGKALRIEGGNISVPEGSWPSCGKGRMCGRGKQARGKRAKNIQHEGGDPMKIAITSIDGTLEGMVDERFGRARKLIVYDMGTDTFEVAENLKQMNLAQGAGIQAAQNVVNLGVRTIISGHLGPKAFQVLQSAGIEAYSAVNITVADAIKHYREGSLNRLSGADVQGHW
ncbi:MAG: hypothetical protein A4E57_00833 [Syntrophorhabdaceae bacterium PtaU1.Bin034]|nr:MAG: hypothetical protein A4E57_00833 [Syntrophorhabdaceae bacterium PtaU1.Bin034]